MILGIGPEVWFPVITLIVGATLKAAFDLCMDSRRNKAVASLRNAERREACRLRMNDFQRESLLELQISAQGLMRSSAKVFFEDLKAVREGKEWGTTLLPKGVDQGQTNVMEK